MPRNVDPITAAGQKRASPRRAYLLHIDIEGDPVFVTEKDRDIWWDWDNSGTPTRFRGVGNLGEISGLDEAIDQQGQSIRVALRGVPLTEVEKVRGLNFKNRPMTIWEVNLDAAFQVEGVPLLRWDGVTDRAVPRVGTQARIEVTAHDHRVDWQRVRATRFTDSDQQRRYPGDLFFEFVPQMAAGKELK